MLGFSFFAVLALRKYTLKRAIVRGGKKVEPDNEKGVKDERKEKQDVDIEAQTVRGKDAEDEDEKKSEIGEETSSVHEEEEAKTYASQMDTNENITTHERRKADSNV